jgi:hypothetical protein
MQLLYEYGRAEVTKMLSYFEIASKLDAPLSVLIGTEEDMVSFIANNISFLTDSNALNFLAHSPHRSLRLKVAESIFSDPETLQYLLSVSPLNDLQMRNALAGNIMLPPESLLLIASESPFPVIMETIALNPTTPSETLLFIHNNYSSPQIDLALALNPTTPDYVIAQLKESPISAVALILNNPPLSGASI